MSLCPNRLCGQEGFVDFGPCLYCCHVIEDGLVLRSDRHTQIIVHKTIMMSELVATEHYPKAVGYWNKKNQYTIEKEGSRWKLVPNHQSRHPTCYNAREITAPVFLKDGDEITVYVSTKDIYISRFTVTIQ